MSGPEGTASYASAPLTTEFGPVVLHAFEWAGEPPYVALTPAAPSRVTHLRIQAQCVTGCVLHSVMCECADETTRGVRAVATRGDTCFVHLPQEGRGYGLMSKVEILQRMATGLDLAAAQRAVGRAASALRYHRVPPILARLEVRPEVLVTGSAAKLDALLGEGLAFRAAVSLDAL